MRINIEDENQVQIKMSFPLAYHFIVSAFEEEKDFYKSAARANPLVDDVYQSQIDIARSQKRRLGATANLDPIEVDFNTKILRSHSDGDLAQAGDDAL